MVGAARARAPLPTASPSNAVSVCWVCWAGRPPCASPLPGVKSEGWQQQGASAAGNNGLGSTAGGLPNAAPLLPLLPSGMAPMQSYMLYMTPWGPMAGPGPAMPMMGMPSMPFPGFSLAGGMGFDVAGGQPSLAAPAPDAPAPPAPAPAAPTPPPARGPSPAPLATPTPAPSARGRSAGAAGGGGGGSARKPLPPGILPAPLPPKRNVEAGSGGGGGGGTPAGGPKQYQCRFCEYASHAAASVMTHERRHTGEKPFSCSFCPYVAARKGQVRRGVVLVLSGCCFFVCSVLRMWDGWGWVGMGGPWYPSRPPTPCVSMRTLLALPVGGPGVCGRGVRWVCAGQRMFG
jgi:hypothetical protein